MYLYLAKTMELSLVHIFNNYQIYFFYQLRLKTEIPSNTQVSQRIPVQIFDATL